MGMRSLRDRETVRPPSGSRGVGWSWSRGLLTPGYGNVIPPGSGDGATAFRVVGGWAGTIPGAADPGLRECDPFGIGTGVPVCETPSPVAAAHHRTLKPGTPRTGCLPDPEGIAFP